MVKAIRSSDRLQDDNSVHVTNTLSKDSNVQVSANQRGRILGSIYTPPDFAQFLTSWAIQHADDRILDIGIGEGAFIFPAYLRLLELGAIDINAQQQLFGTEIEKGTYNIFIEKAKSMHVNFPNLKNTDFFEAKLPQVDVILGNPPYVRRTYIENVDGIRQSVIKRNSLVGELKMTRMTDLHIYFLLHALPLLRPGGKLAVITSDPWLNVGYGEEFKRYLQQHFRIEMLISLDRRVFHNAEVKPVILLATKLENPDLEWQVQFVRVKNGLPIHYLQKSLESLDVRSADVACSKVMSRELKALSPWSIHFKAPKLYEELESHQLTCRVGNMAETRIGLQTLAKNFFVLTQDQVHNTQIEKEFLQPLAQSIRYVKQPVIDSNTEPDFYLFYCDKEQDDLQGTQALEHILRGEAAIVDVRGKNRTVVGFHNKERIKKARRKIWYDLKSSLERRGRASILIPRLVYRNFFIVWNKAAFVPGELFIEVLPPPEFDIEVYLAILTSSICELMLRIHAQVYGGGTFNINPGSIKNVPILNPALLTYQQKEALKQSYLQYLSDEAHNRIAIDNVMQEILGLSSLKQHQINEILEDLILVATFSNKAHPEVILIDP